MRNELREKREHYASLPTTRRLAMLTLLAILLSCFGYHLLKQLHTRKQENLSIQSHFCGTVKPFLSQESSELLFKDSSWVQWLEKFNGILLALKSPNP